MIEPIPGQDRWLDPPNEPECVCKLWTCKDYWCVCGCTDCGGRRRTDCGSPREPDLYKQEKEDRLTEAE